jgi:hypothetical protein
MSSKEAEQTMEVEVSEFSLDVRRRLVEGIGNREQGIGNREQEIGNRD